MERSFEASPSGVHSMFFWAMLTCSLINLLADIRSLGFRGRSTFTSWIVTWAMNADRFILFPAANRSWSRLHLRLGSLHLLQIGCESSRSLLMKDLAASTQRQ